MNSINRSILFCWLFCTCKCNENKEDSKEFEEKANDDAAPADWVVVIICLLCAIAVLLLCFIWAYRDSWCCTCYSKRCCNGPVEDNIELPLPFGYSDGGYTNIETDGTLQRLSQTGLYVKESLTTPNQDDKGTYVTKVEAQELKRQSWLHEDDTDMCNSGYIEDTEQDSVNSSVDDSKFDSLISQAEDWAQDCIRNSIDFHDVCFTETAFIAGLFDNKGGILTMENLGIRLFIPPGALGQEPKLIYIYIAKDSQNMPIVEDGQARVSPTVFCGPNGLQFLERVVLSYDHCANLSDQGTTLLPVFTTSTPNDSLEFRNLEEEDDVLVIKRKGKCTIMISHFTGFSSVATPANPGGSLEMYMDLVAYTSSVSASSKVMIRLYYVHKTADSKQKVIFEEESINGIKQTPFTTWIFKTDLDAISNLEIQNNWEAKQHVKTVPAKMLRENCYVTKSYMLSKEPRSTGNCIQGSIYVTQPGQQDKYNEVLHILTQNEDPPSTSMTRSYVLLKQPLRQALKKLLDPDGLADWRMFAHELELDDIIPKLENDDRRCPTYELLNMWECTRSRNDEDDWLSLEKIFEKMERKDAVSELLKAKSEL